MPWLFVFFLLSGFCSILCELIWLRLAMAQFGVTTALTSIVLSVFMAGLGFGAWLSGALLHKYAGSIRFPAMRIYALIELIIGLSALLVPTELAWGHELLAGLADRAAVSSSSYYIIAGAWLSATMIPFCACMGATIPVAMFSIRRRQQENGDARSFSFLYLANVLGSVLGSFLPLLLIEEFGFRETLRMGASLNALIALMAILTTLGENYRQDKPVVAEQEYCPADTRKSTLVLLFFTGLITMAMELLWIRLYTPYIGPVVYSFGMILVAYLLAMYIGSQVYRAWSKKHMTESRLAWVSLAFFGILAFFTADTRLPLHLVARVFLGVMPFAAMTGFLTPMLVDRWSGGDPQRAGRAYAVNVVGCLLGPLLCGFVLLPMFGQKWSTLLLALPWFAMVLPHREAVSLNGAKRWAAYGILAASLLLLALSKDFETAFPVRRVLRDSTATVIASGTGMKKRLLVNGTGMTYLTPVTKMMAHFTLASLDHDPKSILIICFGMGTTFRSASTWNVKTTAVELVPSVPKLFSFFHSDGDEVKAEPQMHIVVDDGRRYLERTPAKYDAIILDPPPPVQTAGSSLLYSKDFYAVAKKRLVAGGILQQWLPIADQATQASVAKALKDSFPFVNVYRGIDDRGWHFLASERPIPVRTADGLLARMPKKAVDDMMEWGPAPTPAAELNLLLEHPTTLNHLIALDQAIPMLSDNRPVNEFFLIRTPIDQVMAMDEPDYQ
jgi:spermidine synthase